MKIVALVLMADNLMAEFYRELNKHSKKLDVITFIDEKEFEENRATRTFIHDSFVHKYHEEKQYCDNVIKESEVLIVSMGEKDIFKKYLNDRNKIIIRMTERPYKFDDSNFKETLHRLFSSIFNHRIYQKNKPLLLAIGSNAYGDYLRFGNYKNRAYKFGYFTTFDPFERTKKNPETREIKILWTGTFHLPRNQEWLFDAISRLKKKDKLVHLTLLGGGNLQPKYQKKVFDLGIQNQVTFNGKTDYEDVLNTMKTTDVVVVTGGRVEGYNTSILQGMHYGNLIVANEGNGSSKELIADGVNGYLFENKEELYQILEKLYDEGIDPKIVENGILTEKENNGMVAAQRLIKFLNHVKVTNKYEPIYDEGPMSKATFIKYKLPCKKRDRFLYSKQKQIS